MDLKVIKNTNRPDCYYIRNDDNSLFLHSDGELRAYMANYSYKSTLYYSSRKEALIALKNYNESIRANEQIIESEEFTLSDDEYKEAIQALIEQGAIKI